MTRRTFYALEAEAPAETVAEVRTANPYHVDLKHGFTMSDLDAATRMALSRTYGRTLLSRQELYQAAWDGVVDEFLASDAPPDMQHLVAAGSRRVSSVYGAHRRTHGLTDTNDVGPRFAAYWSFDDEPWIDRFHDRIAIAQVWSELDSETRSVITAMALLESRQAAADSLGISYFAFNDRLRKCRQAALQTWFDGETPQQRLLSERGRRVGAYGKPQATHCTKGHEFTPENTQMYRSRPGGAFTRRCKTCVHERYLVRRSQGKRT